MFLSICTKVYHLFNVFMEIYLWISSRIMDLIALLCIFFSFKSEEFGGLTQERKKEVYKQMSLMKPYSYLGRWALFLYIKCHQENEIEPALPRDRTTGFSHGRRKKWSFKDSGLPSCIWEP